MKDKLMKLSALMAILAMMISLFAACGGGNGGSDSGSGGEEAATEEAAKDAEPNAGFGGIVYTIPDGWTVSEKSQEYITYQIPDTDFTMSVEISTEEDFNEIKDSLPEEMKSENLEEYFENLYKSSDEEKEKYFIDQNEITVCDSKAYVTKRANESDTGYVSASAAWMYDNSIYEFFMFNRKAYNREGNPVDGAELMHEDKLELFDEIIATVKPGDGASFANAIEAPKEIGEVTFEVPEGYFVSGFSKDGISFKKEGSKTKIGLNCVTDESLVEHQVTINGEPVTTIDEYYGHNEATDDEKATIAGVEGYIFKHPNYEDGNLYNCNANFKTDNAVYEISIMGDFLDENGIKPDATALTDDEIAAFDAFVDSIKMK